MKILLHDETPSYLVNGGKQVHAQKLYENLNALGVDVEYARWWDPTQKCDLIHTLGCTPGFVWAAKQAGVKLVLSHLVDVTNYSLVGRTYRRLRNQAIRNLHSDRIGSLFAWYAFPSIDALVYLQKFDLEAAISVYGVPRERTSIIPNGCDEDQIARLQGGPRHERSYLISMAGIVPRKNNLLLAQAAHRAEVPVVFLGKPFSDDNEYYRKFLELVDDRYVIYKGYAAGEEKNQWLTGASGFVLLSEAENGSIAICEAAAAGLPVLLSDLPWAYTYGNDSNIQYVALHNVTVIANRLKSFFVNSKRLDRPTFPVMTWAEIANQYISVYKNVLGSGF